MARKKRLKNLLFRIELLGLIIDLTPFRWAPYAFKTKWNILGHRRSTQLFAGPLHVWTFSREGVLTFRLEASFDGVVHGTFTPTGDDAIGYFFRWMTNKLPKNTG